MTEAPAHTATHPGEILREDVLPTLGMSKSEMAATLGISRRMLRDILNEARSITPELALQLEGVCGSTAETWLALQQSYDLQRARERKRREPA